MFKRDWCNGFASGLTVFLLLLAIGLATISFFNHEGCEYAKGEHCQPSDEATTNQPNNFEPWWDWDGLIRTGDTLAQWIMAFLSIVAVFLSGIAAYFVYLTLRQTNKTNRATVTAARAAIRANRIMEADRRPWLDIRLYNTGKPVVFVASEKEFHFPIRYEVINFGKSPAFYITRIVWDWQEMDQQSKPSRQYDISHWKEVIFPDGEPVPTTILKAGGEGDIMDHLQEDGESITFVGGLTCTVIYSTTEGGGSVLWTQRRYSLSVNIPMTDWHGSGNIVREYDMDLVPNSRAV